MRTFAIAAWVIVGIGAACPAAQSGLEVDVNFDPVTTPVDQLVFTLSAPGAAALLPVRAPSTPTPLTSGDESAGFVLPDELIGVDVTVQVDGEDAGNVVSRGSVTITTVRGDIVTTSVALTALPPVLTCGNGALDDAEACDDGNRDAGDGCAACAVEAGWTCAGAPSVCQRCGDGVVQGTEACDDQGTTDGDGCTSGCAVEHGFTCSGAPSACVTACGDGLIGGAEECDDDNTIDGDGCSGTCTRENGWQCTGEQSTCTPVCGDGLRRGAEACDDGPPAASGDGCSATCVVEAGFSCDNQEPTICTTACGDGVTRGNEECDDGVANSDTTPDACRTNCTNPRCGDGVADPGFAEACDDGNTNDGDACLTGCVAARCGDGFKQGAETCDDGNANSGDGCSATCTVEGGFRCGGVPSLCATLATSHTVAPSGADYTSPGAAANDNGTVQNGDTVFIAAATYSGSVTLDNQGNTSNNLRFVAEPGAVLANPNNGNREAFHVTGQNAFIQGLTITNAHSGKSAARIEMSGTLTLVGCTLGDSNHFGIEANAGTTIIVRRSLVTANDGGGMKVDGNYTIENTIIHGNGANNSAVSGADLKNAGTFLFNTVSGNTSQAAIAGVRCQAATTLTSSIIFGNSGTQATAGTCDVTSSDTTVDPIFDVDGVHLAAGSPVVDQAPLVGCPATDFDGDARPINAGCALGADERP